MSGPLVSELTGIITAITDGARYFGKYACTVIRQNADGTIDVKPDDSRVIFPTGLKIRYDSPGWSATVPVGARCNVAFSDGDPRKPYVCDFENGEITRLDFDGGTRNVARVDDAVSCGTIAIVGSATNLTITYTPPTGTPQIVALTLGGGATIAGTGTLTLTGKITTGNPKMRA